MSERPTPETDALIYKTRAGISMFDHARKMERERDEAREKYFVMRDLSNNATELAEKYKLERDEARKDLKITQEAWVKAKAERVEALRERDELRGVLQEIANASHFDNIGNWARNKAKEALKSI